MNRNVYLYVIISLFWSCSNINPPAENSILKEAETSTEGVASLLNRIHLPEGFQIELFAEDVENARSMALSPSGILYVGTRDAGKVYAIQDLDKDNKADKTTVLAEGLEMPNGVALHNGHLYVAEYNRIIRFPNIDINITQPTYEVVTEEYPSKKHHGWKYIAFGPDDKLYVPVGAPCNICESEEIFNTITRIDPDGSNLEIVQRGIRNTVGFDWHPVTGELWFTDNGRDWMGDDKPECELNRAPKEGMHFGYPYCHQGNIEDDKVGPGKGCDSYTPPAAKLGPHTAPLGIEFYEGDQFPADYKNKALIARHGSWNRSSKIGYDLVMATVDGAEASVKPFATGWLDKEADEAWGRPVDVEMLADGSMLVSDDFADVIYRISYKK